MQLYYRVRHDRHARSASPGMPYGYPKAGWWAEPFPNLYVAGLIHGFVAEVPPASK